MCVTLIYLSDLINYCTSSNCLYMNYIIFYLIYLSDPIKIVAYHQIIFTWTIFYIIFYFFCEVENIDMNFGPTNMYCVLK